MFKTPWQILKNNMIFIQPILLSLLLVMMSVTYLVGAFSGKKLLLAFSVLMATIAFMSGWFHINKLGVEDYNPDDEQTVITEKTIKNFKQFFTGVGERFIKFLLGMLIFLCLYFAVVSGVGKICLQLFGVPTLVQEFSKMAQTVATQAELVNFLNGISFEDKLVFSKWVLTILAMSSIMNFFGVLYFTVITYEDKNVLFSLWLALKFIFKNFIKCVSVILVMFALYIFLNILSVPFGSNAITFAILIILLVLYFNYYVLLVFYLYNGKAKDNSDNRTELIG